MDAAETSRNLSLAHNLKTYGQEPGAREYAIDMGTVYCTRCGAVFFAQPVLPDDGHACPAH